MHNRSWGRRWALSIGGLLTAVAVAGCSSPQAQQPASEPEPQPAANPVASQAPQDPAAEDPAEEDPAPSEEELPIIQTEYVHSENRGADVQLYTAYPSGVQDTENLPVVLYLHGRDGMEPTPMPEDILESLERQHEEGKIPDFGFVAVDGGFNSYWNDGAKNGDLSSMIQDELPGWLKERGLGDQNGLPFAVSGISAGGFGALNYAADRNVRGEPVSAVAELAPALPVTWEHMREKNVFDTEQEWIKNDPLRRLGDLGNTPVGLWVGDQDPFLDGARQLADEHPNTPVNSVLPGGHDGSVFDVVGDDQIEFLSEHVPDEQQRGADGEQG